MEPLLILRKEKDEEDDKMKKRAAISSAATVAAAFVILAAIGIFINATIVIIQPAEAYIDPSNLKTEPKAPMAASPDGRNVYVVWWANKSGNWEVMFRASNDGGHTFGDKINLSNSPDTQSRTGEIIAVGNSSVFVPWWELNENVHPHTNESVLRVSTDGGQTFGPVTNLGTNGTLSTTTANTTTTTAAAASSTPPPKCN